MDLSYLPNEAEQYEAALDAGKKRIAELEADAKESIEMYRRARERADAAERERDELKAEVERLREWKRLLDECPAEARDAILQRMHEADAIMPIVAVWRRKLEEAERELTSTKRILDEVEGVREQAQRDQERAELDAEDERARAEKAKRERDELEAEIDAAIDYLDNGEGIPEPPTAELHRKLCESLDAHDDAVKDAERERDEAQDKLADFDRNLLARIDSSAAESTDCYTWMKCKQAEVERLTTENASLRSMAKVVRGGEDDEIRDTTG